MKIGIDLDDVLSESTAAFIKFYNETYGTNLDIKTKEKYGWWEIVDVPREEYEKRVHKFYTTPYFKNTEPINDASETLKKLKKNNELYIITARGNNIKEITEKWVENNFPNIFSKIYYTNQFEQGLKKTTKATICNNLNIDIFIEDSLEFAEDCAKSNRKVYLLDYPWNQTDKLPEGITRVYSWREIDELVNRL